MDFIIHFFRDVLDGPLYVIVAVICGILICSCIGYLAEQSLLRKKAIQDYKDSHAEVSQEESLSWKLQQANQEASVSSSSPIPQNVQNIQAVTSGIPVAVSSSQTLTSDAQNNSQNIVP